MMKSLNLIGCCLGNVFDGKIYFKAFGSGNTGMDGGEIVTSTPAIACKKRKSPKECIESLKKNEKRSVRASLSHRHDDKDLF